MEIYSEEFVKKMFSNLEPGAKDIFCALQAYLNSSLSNSFEESFSNKDDFLSLETDKGMKSIKTSPQLSIEHSSFLNDPESTLRRLQSFLSLSPNNRLLPSGLLVAPNNNCCEMPNLICVQPLINNRNLTDFDVQQSSSGYRSTQNNEKSEESKSIYTDSNKERKRSSQFNYTEKSELKKRKDREAAASSRKKIENQIQFLENIVGFEIAKKLKEQSKRYHTEEEEKELEHAKILGKKQKRLIKNRISAQKGRDEKKKYIELLEQEMEKRKSP